MLLTVRCLSCLFRITSSSNASNSLQLNSSLNLLTSCVKLHRKLKFWYSAASVKLTQNLGFQPLYLSALSFTSLTVIKFEKLSSLMENLTWS